MIHLRNRTLARYSPRLTPGRRRSAQSRMDCGLPVGIATTAMQWVTSRWCGAVVQSRVIGPRCTLVCTSASSDRIAPSASEAPPGLGGTLSVAFYNVHAIAE